MRVLSTRTLDEFGKSAAFSVAMWRVSTQPRPVAVLRHQEEVTFVELLNGQLLTVTNVGICASE